MEKSVADPEVEALLGRFDRSSAQTLLVSLANEFLRLERAHNSLASRVKSMEALQSAIDRVVAARIDAPAADFPKKARFLPEDSLQEAAGFYNLEHDPTGRGYRWTGPEPHFSFPFFLDRRAPARFRLTLGGLAKSIPIEAMRCFVDGEEVAGAISQAGDGWEITGTLPQKDDSAGTVLTFACPFTASPAETEGSADTRKLGVIFRALLVEAETTSPASQADNRASVVSELPRRVGLTPGRR